MIDVDETLHERGAEWARRQPPAPNLTAAIERIPVRRKHIRTYLAVAATVVAVAVLSTVWLIQPSGSSPSASTTAARGGPNTPREVVDPVLSRLYAIALQTAAGNGELRPTAIQVVKTTRSAANQLEDGSTSNQPDLPVWLLQEQGRFVCNDCRIPAGSSPPTGTVISLVVDARTYAGLDFGMYRVPVNLASLGKVIDLPAAAAARP